MDLSSHLIVSHEFDHALVIADMCERVHELLHKMYNVFRMKWT